MIKKRESYRAVAGSIRSEWLRGLSRKICIGALAFSAAHIRPAAVIAIDALAARSRQRLCATVQLSDTGLIPGSGVGNHRRAVDRAALGVPVIAVGVPTVIDGATLCADLLEEAGRPQQDLSGRGADLFVTPQDIDQRVTDLGRIVGYGITLALQRGLTLEDVTGLLG